MPRVYRYVVAHDTGAAPNVDGGYCTLAICKPVIRRKAQQGDWVVGLWPAPNPKRITFVMRVGSAISFGEYWNEPRFAHKKPGRSSTPDNIYRHSADGPIWVPNCIHTENKAHHDLGGQHVLIGDDFWYFGGTPVELPTAFWDLDFPNPRRGHRIQTWTDEKLEAFVKWLRSKGTGVLGQPRDSGSKVLTSGAAGRHRPTPKSRC